MYAIWAYCHWVVSIHLPWLANLYAPITLQRLGLICAPSPFTRLFHRTYLSHPFFWCVHLPNISSGCFDQPSFGLWARRASSAPRWWGCRLVVSIHLPLARIRPGMLPLHYNDLFDMCPAVVHICHRLHYVHCLNDIYPKGDSISFLIYAPFIFYKTFPSHISVTSIFLMCPSSYNIIGLFRSTVLRVMSPTRFLCATMMGCHWVVSIHLP